MRASGTVLINNGKSFALFYSPEKQRYFFFDSHGHDNFTTESGGHPAYLVSSSSLEETVDLIYNVLGTPLPIDFDLSGLPKDFADEILLENTYHNQLDAYSIS